MRDYPPYAYPYFKHRWFEIDENTNLMVNSPWGLRYEEYNLYTPVQRAAGISSQYWIIGDFDARITYSHRIWYTDNDNALPGGNDYLYNLYGFAISKYDTNLLSYDYPDTEEEYFDSDQGGGWPFIGLGYAEGKYGGGGGGCPEGSITEDFTGTDGTNPSGWNEYSYNGAVFEISSNQYKTRCYASYRTTVYGRLVSTVEMCGDFDVQVDLNNISITNPITASSNAYIGIGMSTWYVGDVATVFLAAGQSASYGSYEQSYYGSVWDADHVVNSRNQVLTSDTTSKFRLTRVGSTCSAYYWDTVSSSWVLLAQETDSETGTCKIYLFCSSHAWMSGATLAEGYFDNLTAEYGGGGGDPTPNRGFFVVDDSELHDITISPEDTTIGGNENYEHPTLYNGMLRIRRIGENFYCSWWEEDPNTGHKWVWYNTSGVDITQHTFTATYTDPVSFHIFFQTMYRGQMLIWVRDITFDYYEGVICPNGTVRFGYP